MRALQLRLACIDVCKTRSHQECATWRTSAWLQDDRSIDDAVNSDAEESGHALPPSSGKEGKKKKKRRQDAGTEAEAADLEMLLMDERALHAARDGIKPRLLQPGARPAPLARVCICSRRAKEAQLQ